MACSQFLEAATDCYIDGCKLGGKLTVGLKVERITVKVRIVT